MADPAAQMLLIGIDAEAAEAARDILGDSSFVQVPVGPETPSQRAWRIIADSLDGEADASAMVAAVEQAVWGQLSSRRWFGKHVESDEMESLEADIHQAVTAALVEGAPGAVSVDEAAQ